MGCLPFMSDKEKGDVEESQKWVYLTLSDFKASGSLTYFSYIWLWFLAIVAVAVYGADTFTAVNLLAYGKWSSQIEPAIKFEYSKWIFAVCIIISWVLCAFEWVRAIRVIRTDSVAGSYMDPLAVTLQSMRPQGWKRFLVFAELTKSKKGVDYIALFVYFQFKGAIRIILAEAPRQVVNGITLYSVMNAELAATGTHAATGGHSSIQQFFINLETLADSNQEQTVVLFTMLFTLCIWVISALSLIVAVILYLVFLWHYIPQQDGRLSIYCRRKIDRRLEKIVSGKVKQALEDQEKERLREEAKITKTGKVGQNANVRRAPIRQPTLPQLAGTTPRIADDRLPEFVLVRQDSQATLPSLNSQHSLHVTENSGIARQPTLPDIRPVVRPGMPSRIGTEASAFSNASYESNVPLLGNATEMGYDEIPENHVAHPRPVLDRQTSASSHGSRPMANRQMSASSQDTGSRPLMDRQMSASSYGSRPPVNRQMSASPHDSRPLVDRQMSASPYDSRPMIDRQMSASSYGFRVPPTRAMTPLSEVSLVPNDFGHPEADLNSPSYEMQQHRVSPPLPTSTPFNPRQESMMCQNMFDSNAPSQIARTQSPYRAFSPPTHAATARGYTNGYSSSPAPYGQAYEMTSRPAPAILPPMLTPSPAPSDSGYVAFNPQFSAQRRGMTTPTNITPAPAPYPVLQRSATAPPEAGAYDDLIDEYHVGAGHDHVEFDMPTRSATAGPSGHSQW